MSDRPLPFGDPELLRDRLSRSMPLSLWAHWRLLVGGIAVLLALVVWIWPGAPHREPSRTAEQTMPRATPPETGAAAPADTSGGGRVVVQVSGAVNEPGVVEVAKDARVDDAVKAAGGLAGDADAERVNLAAKLVDGQRIYVLRKGQTSTPEAAGPSSDAPTSGGPVDLNTATVEALDKLPGVGPATATAIVEYRRAHGPFRSVADLAKVKGIGPAKLEQIKPLVQV